MNGLATNLVANRGNRCTATILGFLEENLYEQYDVPPKVQQQIRRIVLDSINSYKDLAIDVVKSGDSMINDFWLEELQKIHTSVDELRRDLYEED